MLRKRPILLGKISLFSRMTSEVRTFGYMKMPERGSSGQYSGCEFRHLFPCATLRPGTRRTFLHSSARADEGGHDPVGLAGEDRLVRKDLPVG